MIAHKHITKIIAAVMALAVAVCLCAVIFSDQITAAITDDGVSMEYETKLFDTDSIISVNIIMDEDSWSDMLANAAKEEYYQCDVEINGTTFYRVGIRPKGNTSLSSIVNDPTTDRYSFKLEFDHYVDGQTCFGLDKLILNNNYADATNMKEALIYDMFKFLGADASLYNYASISVNGEYWGVYLALEAVEDSFMLRNYGVQDGELYKPEGMGGGGDNGGGPGGSMNGGGADLNYSDDDLDSYSTIWDGEITSTNDADHQRVVTALKNISEGTDLEKYMDIDNLLRYMAVHVFSVNDDSLSGNMAHNYYLYESKGMLNLLPWDYNLALGSMGGGGMGGNGATSAVNDPIDNAFSATDFFDTLMDNETYHSQYYAYLQQLVSEYVEGGGFDTFYERVRSQIDELVATDPTAFYTSDEYQTAADTLYQFVKLRGESIQGQLDGTIPSTESEQRSSDALIDASSINLSAMGSMGGGNEGGPGGGPGGDFGGMPGESNSQEATAQETPSEPAGSETTAVETTVSETKATETTTSETVTSEVTASGDIGSKQPSDGFTNNMAQGMELQGDTSQNIQLTANDSQSIKSDSDNSQDTESSDNSSQSTKLISNDSKSTALTGSEVQSTATHDNDVQNEKVTDDNKAQTDVSVTDNTNQDDKSVANSTDHADELTTDNEVKTEETTTGSETADTQATETESQDGNSPGGPGGSQPGQSDGESADDQMQGGPGQFGGDMQGGFGMPGSDSSTSQTVSTETLILYGVSILVIIAALIFALLYKRKPRRK